MTREHIHFVTGRLAEPSLRDETARLASLVGFEHSIQVLPISVAALLTPRWIEPRLAVPPGTTRVLVPGYCGGDLSALEQRAGVPVARGPKDLRDLAEFFAQGERPPVDLSNYDIEILAEINHAPRLSRDEIVRQADALAADGADVIDLGCEPGHIWRDVGDAVRALRDRGYRVSIDSLEAEEIGPAVAAGAELVLSVNSINLAAAADWNAEVVAIPDRPDDWRSLETTLETLDRRGARFRVDPILEPIGFGLAASLGRYLEARRRWPAASMLMGIGNLTELTDVDSAGMNMLLLGVCQELRIHSVLTTQVIPWCQSAVRECDRARRILWAAARQKSLPKHVDDGLVMLRDAKLHQLSAEELRQLAARIRDPNYRLFVSEGALHALAAGKHFVAADAFELLERMQSEGPPVDASHAFYLGYELSKATTALTLGKQYRQDEALRWGLLTRDEPHRRGRVAPDADNAPAIPADDAPLP